MVDFDRREAEPLIYHGGSYGRVQRRLSGENLEREGLAERVGEELSLTASGAELLAALQSLAKR